MPATESTPLAEIWPHNGEVTIPAALPPADDSSTPARRDALRTGSAMGLLCMAMFVSVGHVAAHYGGRASSPVLALGEGVIDRTPPWLKDFAIESFGTNDKAVLIGSVVCVMALLAAAVGIVAARFPAVGAMAITIVAVIAAAAATARPDAGPGAALPAIVGGAAAMVAFTVLRQARPKPDASTEDRRRFLRATGGVLLTSAAFGVLGTWWSRRGAAAEAARSALVIPSPRTTTAPVAGTDLGLDGLSPFFTPTEDFYRIDTALVVPELTPQGWSLRITGMVEREMTLSYDELVAREIVERDITLACVSNPVGGPYIGNARWTGILLKPLLEEAGIQPGADQILSTSVDGWTCGTPTDVVMDGRDAMLAIAMNGEPLPFDHGFPVRMVVPGLYGYVSATKWVTELRLTTMSELAYWMTRGWSQLGPIKTHSRIDVPRTGRSLPAGRVAIAGVAWAQHRGIERVEININDGPWLRTRLAAEDTTDTWRQWVYEDWQPTRGVYRVQVRATDKTGYVQTSDIADVAPDGATGYDLVVIRIS